MNTLRDRIEAGNSMNMGHGLRENGKVTIVDLRGCISSTRGASEPSLHQGVEDLVEKGSRRLVLNLSEVMCVDSSGIGELVSCLATVRSHGGDLKIVNAPQEVKELLRLTRVDTIIAVIGDEGAAIDSYRRVVTTTLPSVSCFEP